MVGTKAMAVFDDVEPWARKLAVYRHAVWQDSGHWAFTANEPAYVPVEEGMPLTRELEHFLECIETRAQSADQRRGGDRGAEDPDGRHRHPRLSRSRRLLGRNMRRRGRQPRQHRLGLGAALGARDEAAAEHARLGAVVGIEHAGLAGRDAGFAVGELDPGLAAT